MFKIIGTVLGGAGLFFVGLQFLTENIKKAAGPRFRRIVAAWTNSPVMGLLWGGVAGCVTQSTSVTTFILISLLTSGLLVVKSALPIVIGANIGTSLLVYVASINVKVFFLFLIGIAGIAMTSERTARFRTFARALFGAGLLFLGLNMIQAGAHPLADQPWFAGLLRKTGSSYALAFLAGGALAFLVQSAAAVSVLVIALATAGIFTIEQTMMIIYGANFGSSMITLALSSRIRGRARQLAMCQVAYNIVGCVIMVPLFYVEIHTELPVARALVTAGADRIGLQMAHLYLVFNVSAGVVLMLVRGPSTRILNRFWPPTEVEEESRLRYIHDQALYEPETALDLAMLEQGRLIGFFPRYIEALRGGSHDEPAMSVDRVHALTANLSGGIRSFLQRIGENTELNHSAYQRLGNINRNSDLLAMIDEALKSLCAVIEAEAGQGRMEGFQASVVESVDTVLLTLNDAVQGSDDYSRSVLSKITGDRSGLMESIRARYLADDSSLDADAKKHFLEITNICERLFWLLGSLTLSLEKSLFRF